MDLPPENIQQFIPRAVSGAPSESQITIDLDADLDGHLRAGLIDLVHGFLDSRAKGDWAVALDEETQCFSGMYDCD